MTGKWSVAICQGDGPMFHAAEFVEMQVQVFGAKEEQHSDVEAIVDRVAMLQRAQQHESVNDFMTLIDEKCPVWTTAHGRCLCGWEAIDAFARRVLPGAMKESTATYHVIRIQFVRPDVAVVNVRQRPVHLDGRPLEGVPEGRPIYVMAKDEDDWKIVAGQNTLVVDPKLRSPV